MSPTECVSLCVIKGSNNSRTYNTEVKTKKERKSMKLVCVDIYCNQILPWKANRVRAAYMPHEMTTAS